MPVFNAQDIVGKTLIARRNIPLYQAGNFKKPFAQVRSGQPVGVVYAWIGPNTNTGGKLYWQFYNKNGTTYYAEHVKGAFSVQALKEQGVLTTLEQVQQEQDNAQPPTLLGSVTKIAIWGIVAFAGVKLITNVIENRSGGGSGRIIYLK